MNQFVSNLLKYERRLWERTDLLPKFILKVVRVTILVVRGVVKERPMMRAAALTYTSTLTMIPTMAMVFGLIEFVFPVENYQNKALSLIQEVIKDPERAEMIRDRALNAIEAINGGGIAGFSLILVLAGALTLISNIEQAFNHIWGIARMRALKLRIMNYLTILITGPIVLVTASTVFSARGLSFLEKIEYLKPFVDVLKSAFAALLPFLLITLFLFILFYMIPNVTVGIKAALAGASVAAVLFSANQIIAMFFVGRFATMSKIYGSMSIIPILLIWMFVAWMIILIGAQIVYAWDNVEGFRREYLLDEVSPGIEEVVALRLMTEMASRFHKDGQPTDYEVVGESWQLPNRLMRKILERLEECRLVHRLGDRETRYVPGRELETITVGDILLAMRFGERGFRVPGGTDALAQWSSAAAVRPHGQEHETTLLQLAGRV